MVAIDKRRFPRCGFFASSVVLSPQTGAPALTVECITVLINRTGMGIAVPPMANRTGCPFAKDDRINVSIKPILIHRSKVQMEQWTLPDVQVRWTEEVTGASGETRAWLIGMEFSHEHDLPASVQSWIDYLTVAEGLVDNAPPPVNSAIPGENFFIGANALGVASGIIALLWVRDPPWARDFFLGIMVATTVAFGFHKFGWMQWFKRLVGIRSSTDAAATQGR